MRFANASILFTALVAAACGQKPPQTEAEPPPSPPRVAQAPVEAYVSCEIPDSDFEVSANTAGHGSLYYGIIDKCSDGIKVIFDVWTAEDASYAFESDSCPDKAMLRHEAKMPKIDDRPTKIQSELADVRRVLELELQKFRVRCGVDSERGGILLDGFEKFYAAQLKASWIKNRYIESLGKINRLGWGDENLLNEAREAYAQRR